MKKQLEQARQFNDTSQFEQALKALREPINAAKSGTDSSILSQLLVEKGIALKRQGQTTEAVETYQWALKVATKLEDRRQQAVIHTNLAVIANEVGDQDRAQALVLRALKLHRELKNSRSEGLCLLNLGSILSAKGDHRGSLDCIRQAKAISKTIEHHNLLAGCLFNEGTALVDLGESQDAIGPFRESIVLSDKNEFYLGGLARSSLAAILAERGSFEEAETLLTEAEPLVQANVTWLSCFYASAGRVTQLKGELQQALALRYRATRTAEKARIPPDSPLRRAEHALKQALEGAVTPTVMASMEMELGHLAMSHDPSSAECHYLRAMELHRDTDDTAGVCRAHVNLGNSHRARADFERATKRYREAIDSAREGGHLSSLAAALGNLGGTLADQGRPEEALAPTLEAFRITKSMGNKRKQAAHLANLACLELSLGEAPDAIRKLDEALELSRTAGDKTRVGIILVERGRAHLGDQRFDRAESDLREGIPICDIHLPAAAGLARGSLAHLLALTQRTEEIDALLKRGENQLQTMPQKLAEFFCLKARIELQKTDRSQAIEWLEKARVLVSGLHLSDSSPLLAEIRTLEGLAKGTHNHPKNKV